MRVTVFTSNQPRHVALIEALCGVADMVYAVQECTTLFPGEIRDFYRQSSLMQTYFEKVRAAEREVFGSVRFGPREASHLCLKSGDLNRIGLAMLEPALNSDAYVVFGASYVTGELCEFLQRKKCFNIHMGVSPYYRGSSTNFWALYDRRPDYVGATIHLLTDSLDGGPILFHAFPPAEALDSFILGMRAVKAAHSTFIESLRRGEIWNFEAVPQDMGLQIRYTRNREFTDDVVQRYLENLPERGAIKEALQARNLSAFVRPCIG